jgi:pilus assembly protein CpaC
LTGLLIIAWAASIAFAQETVIKASFKQPETAPVPIYVLTGHSCLIIFDQPVGRLAISNTEAAEPVVVAPYQMMINGKLPGRVRVTTWSKDGSRFIFFDVDVRANLEQIDSHVRALFPKEEIRLSQANGSVVISGKADSKIAQQVESVVQAAGFKTVNLLAQPLPNTLQVQLQVRVAEVSRNKLHELAASPAYQLQPGEGGYTNTGQGPWTLNKVDAGSMFGSVANSLNLFVMSHNAFMFLRALQTQGALRALAEPNLIAMNGQQASFLAGGELPIPVVQGGANSTVVIIWKEYGVRVNFKPTILDEQHIRLEIEPEVSTLDYNNAIRFEGFLIPALRTRRAKTGIELQDGQSFGIAGLLDNSETKALSKIPVLGDVPILGNLFKSKSFQRNESEMVFIVTAKITRPLNPDAVPLMRGVDGLRNGSPLGMDMPGASSSDGTPSGSSVSGASAGGASTNEPATSNENPSNTKDAPVNSDSPKEDGSKSKSDAPSKGTSEGNNQDWLKARRNAWRIMLPDITTLPAQQLQGRGW